MVANCTYSRVVCGIIAQWFGFKVPAQNAEQKYISTTDPSTSIENKKYENSTRYFNFIQEQRGC
jgi:hypothetical protein